MPGAAPRWQRRSTEPTAKQRQAYDLRAQGKTWQEVGDIMGCRANTAVAHAKGAEKRGMPPLLKDSLRTRAPAPNAGEPGRVARLKEVEGLFAAGNGPVPEFDKVKFVELAASAGIPPRVAQALARRMEMQFGPVRSEIRKLTLAEQVTATTAAAQLVLAHIDEVSIAGMNAKDLAIAYGVLVDKSLLLGGKPTQIVDFNVRAKIEVLMPAMLQEAARRGITMDGQFTRISESENVDTRKTETTP